MAYTSYIDMSNESELQLLMSTVVNSVSNELRYARDIKLNDDGTLQRYTSSYYGKNTIININSSGQLSANSKRMISSGVYGNGKYKIEQFNVSYDALSNNYFNIYIKITGIKDTFKELNFSVRCLNPIV